MPSVVKMAMREQAIIRPLKMRSAPWRARNSGLMRPEARISPTSATLIATPAMAHRAMNFQLW